MTNDPTFTHEEFCKLAKDLYLSADLTLDQFDRAISYSRRFESNCLDHAIGMVQAAINGRNRVAAERDILKDEIHRLTKAMVQCYAMDGCSHCDICFIAGAIHEPCKDPNEIPTRRPGFYPEDVGL